MVFERLASVTKLGRAASKLYSIFRALVADRRPKLAYVGGWLGKRNLGDEALLAATRKLFPGFDLLPFEGDRATQYLARHSTLFRAGLLAGGTLIAQNRWWLSITESFLQFCPNLAVFGTGVEDASFWPGETTVGDWVPVLRHCSFVGVRGPISAELLSSAGLENVEVVGDPVLAFAMNEINPNPIPKTIGLNIGVSDRRVWGSERQVCDQVSRLARVARESGWTVRWFAVWPKDLRITQEAASNSGTTACITTIYEDHAKFLNRVRSMSVFVGMKLHATILATCALTPSIMLEYRPKCRDYMASIGQEDVTFKTDSFRAEEIWEVVQTCHNDRLERAKSLARTIHALRDKQQQLAASVARQLESNV